MKTFIKCVLAILAVPFVALWAFMEALTCLSILLVGLFYKEEAKAYVQAKIESVEKLIENIK